jgi:hypothetical protein
VPICCGRSPKTRWNNCGKRLKRPAVPVPRRVSQLPSGSAGLPARRAAAMLLKILTEAVGREKALLGARTLVAFLHGFILMETSGLFRFGGDINQAFKFGLKTILNALLKM